MTGMQISRQNIAIAVGAVIIVIAAVIYYMNNTSSPTVDESLTTATSSVSTTATTTEGIIAAGGTGDYTITAVPVAEEQRPTAPDYTKPLVVSTSLTAAEKLRYQTGYAQLQALIKTDSMDFNAWVSLGTLNLMAGNYATARTIWDYVSTVWPGNYVTPNNLGDLYMNYLHDYVKAESNFLQAIKLKADDLNPYKNLFTIYTTTSYKPTNTAAEDILKKGIAANPKAVDLQVLLARHYKTLGRTADAKAMYDAAIANATAQGQTDLATTIRTESTL